MQVKLREFQQEILEMAREENVVMVGETGIGKTFLAIALLSEQDYSGDKRAFFMAPTRQLVLQITAKIQQTSTLRAGAYCGRNVDLWDAKHWQQELLLNRVFVCTPEIVRNVLEKGYVAMNQINLLVFDECHHVTKRHTYAQVIKLYSPDLAHEMPRIFGTTSCPTRHCAEKLHARLKKVELDNVQKIEFAVTAPLIYETYAVQKEWDVGAKQAEADSDNTQLSTDHKMTLTQNISTEKSWMYAKLQAELEEVKVLQVFEKLVKKGKTDAANDEIKRAKMSKRFVQSCVTIYNNLGPWCFYRFVELEIERLALGASLLITIPGSMYGLDRDAVKTILLLSAKRNSCNFACTHKVEKVEELIRSRLFSADEDERDDEPSPPLSPSSASSSSAEDGDDISTPAPVDVADDAKESSPSEKAKEALQGIVFVNTRSEARVLTEFFNEKFTHDQEKEGGNDEVEQLEEESTISEVLSEPLFACILGTASRSDTASFNLPKIPTILANFEAGKVRVLISTAVSVEGVDFPQCGLIIVIDRVQASRMLIQLRGRARHEDGVVYYLGEHDDLGHFTHYQQLCRESEAINSLDFSREKEESIARLPRTEAAKHWSGGDDWIIRIESTGAQLDLDSSIATINMFCQSLPKNLFKVDQKNMYTYTEISIGNRKLFSAELRLPSDLNIEPFTFKSDNLQSKAAAKAAAAFLACRQLLATQFLDESLNSVYRSSKLKSASKVQDLSYFLNRIHN